MPVATMQKLLALAEGGVKVVFEDAVPSDVPGLADLPNTKRLMPLRRELLDSFEPAMLPVGCVDRYALMGAIAGWWDEIRYELRVIVENGFAELVDGWVETDRRPKTGRGCHRSAECCTRSPTRTGIAETASSKRRRRCASCSRMHRFPRRRPAT